MNTKSLILIIITTISVMACNQKQENEEQSVESKNHIVETVAIQELKLSRKVTLPGELKPWNKVNIMARVKGYAGKILVDRGSVVKQGQILAILEAPEVMAELSILEGKLAAVKGQVIEYESQLRVSKLTYQRMVETSQTVGAISTNEVDLAYSKMMVDSALTISTKGMLSATQAQISAQQQMVNYLTIKAPFDGIITERNISPGALVGSSDNSSHPLFVLEEQTKLRLTVAIPENMANTVLEESKLDFIITAEPGKIFTTKFSRSANSLQEQNRSMLIEFDVENKSGELKAGMYAEVILPIMRDKATLVVPGTALVHTSEGVYVINVKNSKANWININKGNQLDSLVEIFGDIKLGDKVVLKADPEIRDGQTLLTK